MSAETTFKGDGSYHDARETSRNYVQLFPADQSNDAGVWQITFRQAVSTFRSVAFPLTTITHATYSRTLANPNTGALVAHYLVGETINSIVDGTIVDFTRTYAPEISDVETVASQSISIPDWNGLEEDGTFSATIDNRRTAIYTARKSVTAISELEEIETINASDIKATIHGTIDIDGTTSDLTQSVDDIWTDLFLISGLTSVLKSSTSLRLNTTLDSVDSWSVSISGLNAGTGYIVGKTNVDGGSFIEIEFVYTRSIVEGTLTLQSRDPKIIYESDFSAGVDGVTGTNCALAGNIDGIGGEDNCLRVTENGASSTCVIYPATPTAPDNGAYLLSADIYIPTSGGVDRVYWSFDQYTTGGPVVTAKDTWTTLTLLRTGSFTTTVKALQADGNNGIFYVKNIKIETIDRTIDLSGTPAEILADLNCGNSIKSVVTDSQSVRFVFVQNSVYLDDPVTAADYAVNANWFSASIANPTSYVSHAITADGNALNITFNDTRQASEITTNPQSVRTLTVSGHGFIQGDIVALFAGDTLVGVTTCSAVIDTNSFQIPANALPGKDDIVTHVGDKSTQSTFSSYPQTVLVTTTKKVYIPGVSSGVDSLNDIPVRQGLDTPQSWLIAITESLATAQIEGTLIEHPYPGLYITTESEFAMADVLNQTDSFLADVDGTLLLVDW